MHNPFQLYSPQLLNALLKAGHGCFVRQTYKRGLAHFDREQKGAFLISYYNDKSKAQIHFEALKNDGNRFFYDVSEKGDLEKLQKAATQPKGYKIYAPLLLREWKPSDVLVVKVRKYIDYSLQWRAGSGDTVKTNLFTQFGEIFITLKLGIHEVKIPLSEIERL
ncbi:MAG: hypothetical protein ABI416_18080 [Ginsengibacter sp.]